MKVKRFNENINNFEAEAKYILSSLEDFIESVEMSEIFFDEEKKTIY